MHKTMNATETGKPGTQQAKRVAKHKLLWVTLLALCVGLIGSAASANGTNLLQNAGFGGYTNDVLDVWENEQSETVFAFPSREPGEFLSDGQGRGYWLGGGTDVRVTLKQTVAQVPGGTYKAEIFSRASAEGFSELKLNVYVGGTLSASADLPKGETYAPASVEVDVPDGSAVTFAVEALSPAGEVFFTLDDASLTAVAAAGGSSTDAGGSSTDAGGSAAGDGAAAEGTGAASADTGAATTTTLPKTGSELSLEALLAAALLLAGAGVYLQLRKTRASGK